jgi:symplekin
VRPARQRESVESTERPLTRSSTAAAIEAVEPLSRLLANPPDLAALKAALAGFASAYPFIFRYACVDCVHHSGRPLTMLVRNRCQSGDQNQWNRVISLKMAVLQLWRNGSVGGKVGAVKAIQRIVQTQSTAQTADPRVRLVGVATPCAS